MSERVALIVAEEEAPGEIIPDEEFASPRAVLLPVQSDDAAAASRKTVSVPAVRSDRGASAAGAKSERVIRIFRAPVLKEEGTAFLVFGSWFLVLAMGVIIMARVANAILKLRRIQAAEVGLQTNAATSATEALTAVQAQRDAALANALDADDVKALEEIEALPEPA